ncbi:hypothetical protein ACIQVT_00620 [Streptomyces sp. NPDC100445]|uniref:hypothetical protein n=1 Tax=Streptomyces sp. NPDC100445 TaxID=3366102 RepID=UPI0037FCDA57
MSQIGRSGLLGIAAFHRQKAPVTASARRRLPTGDPTLDIDRHGQITPDERSRGAFDSDLPRNVLKASTDAMKAAMLDEGLKVLERGQAWSSTIGGIQVRLDPR